MSAKAEIAMIYPNGTVRSVSLEIDGEIEFAGAILAKFYTKPKIVAALINLGSLRKLGEKLNPSSSEEHSFSRPQRNVTIAYERDKGDFIEGSTFYQNKTEFLRQGRIFTNAQFLYLYDKGQWFVAGKIDREDEFLPVN